MPPFPRFAHATLHATLTGMERARRPKLGGRIAVGGLAHPVEILRDRWGVPHIYADSATDLLFAQGFVHAQDRLWQMDFQRRVAAGRLSEVLGPALLEADRALRVLGMYRVAQAEVEMLSREGRAELEAYAAGVNACMAGQPLPVEFGLLRYRPEDWSPADSLSWAKMLSWGLSINWETELLRARLIEVLGPERAAELEPVMPGPVVMAGGSMPHSTAFDHSLGHSGDRDGEESRDSGQMSGEMAPDRELPSVGGTAGSNNWVIAGSRTATGKPILANDMHLPVTAPAIWFENHLVSGSAGDPLDVTGVSFPGIPYVVAGHNGCVAWGFTNGYPDVQDLFVEHLRITPGGVEYEFRGEWRPARVRQEEIRVKGAAPATIEVIETCHGPILNSLAPGLATAAGPDGLPEQPLALRWTSLDPYPMVETLRGMNRARTCRELRDALRDWVAPTQNVVYADTQGNIAYSYAGKIPVRAKGEGRVPAPGWTGEYDWTGFIPFEELPHQENPPEGFVVSANNRVADETYPHFVGREFSMGDRAQRIRTMIRAARPIKLSDIRAMQMDQQATSLIELAKHIGALDVEEEELAGLVTLVRDWDGDLSADSPAGAVLEIFGRQVQIVVMDHALGAVEPLGKEDIALVDRVLGRGPAPAIQETTFFYHRVWEWLYTALERPEWHWWDVGHGETRDDVLRIALRRTYSYLERRLGKPEPPDYANWAWGRLHMVTFGHVAGRVPSLARHFNRGPYPLGGDGNTVFATGGGLTVEASTAVIAPPFRFIADLSDLSRCYGLLVPGNSGRASSPHYDDQIEAWFKGKYHPMLYARADVERGARRRLRLAPRQSPHEGHAGRNEQARRQS